MSQDDASYYVLYTVNRHIFNLDVGEGDRLATQLDWMRMTAANRAEADVDFVHFVDTSGSDVRVHVSHIEAFYLSTPATRAADEAFRKELKLRKDWSDDDA